MSKSQVFTGSLPLDLKQTLAEYATKHQIPKNKVIEQALTFFFYEEKRKTFIDGIKKYGQDKENIELAEWGMDDYAEQLNRYQ